MSISSTTTQIKNQYIFLANAARLLKTICNGCNSWFIDYVQDIQACILHSCTQVSFGHVKHLSQDHRWDFLRSKTFLFAIIVYHNHRLITRTFSDLKWPMFDIALNQGIRESLNNQPLCICNTIPFLERVQIEDEKNYKTTIKPKKQKLDIDFFFFFFDKYISFVN